MFKNKEIRYRFSKYLNKNNSISERSGWLLLRIITLISWIIATVLLTFVFSEWKHIEYLYSLGLAVTIILTMFSALSIHKDVKTKNLLVKISLGMKYREYILGASFVYWILITLLTLTSFFTLSSITGDWYKSFVYMFSLLSVCLFLYSIYLMACIFMANSRLMIFSTVVFIIAIISISASKSLSYKWLLNLFEKGLTINAIIMVVDILLSLFAAFTLIVLTPKMNFINWFDDSIKVAGGLNFF